MINIDKIISKGTKFYEQTINNENDRFKSWEYCYKSFQEAYQNKIKGKSIDYDYLCLQLSFYLASWGMYRGSSFLLELDYKVHEPVVRFLFKDDYKPLWQMKINKDKNQELGDFYAVLEDLKCKIKKYYSEKRKKVNKGISPQKDISDILVSKILLGTIGCIPAYDRFFISGISTVNISPKTLNKDSIKALIEYYKENYNKFEELRNKMSTKDLKYSQMKVLDSCFWQLGYDIKNPTKGKKAKNMM